MAITIGVGIREPRSLNYPVVNTPLVALSNEICINLAGGGDLGHKAKP